jgi:transposase-like protein
MRYPASEKLEIIRLVEQSHLSVKRTLEKLGIPRATFYSSTSDADERSELHHTRSPLPMSNDLQFELGLSRAPAAYITR